jgi:hypothetical protein
MVSYSEDIQEELKVDSVQYCGEFKLNIIFNDGIEKRIDFLPFLEKSAHPEIKKYLDEKLFKDFQLTEGNINWNDFDLIFPISSLRKGEI